MSKQYFEIKVQSSSVEELNRRVADNESRGFKTVRYYEFETEGNYNSNSKYKAPDGTNRRMIEHSAHKTYGAVMRRDNRDYVKVAQ